MFKVNDAVQIIAGAIYLNNEKEVPESLFNTKLYIREVKSNSAVVARAKTGPVLGEIANENLISLESNISNIEPYYIQVPIMNLPAYQSPNKTSGVVKRFNRFALLTIVNEKNGFGKIKVGSGWIELAKVTKL